MLSLLAPRYYSISSSPSVDPARCSVTVGVVKGRPPPAAASTRASARTISPTGARATAIHATVRETKAGFRLPDDPSVPIIMIGPGTGLAPFRGFLQERAARKAKGAALGPAMLFFGCRHPEQDFLYADELKGLRQAASPSSSRRSRARTDRRPMCSTCSPRRRTRSGPLIEQGAIIYVCGDGGKMEPDVKAALMSIHREKTGSDAARRRALDRGRSAPRTAMCSTCGRGWWIGRRRPGRELLKLSHNSLGKDRYRPNSRLR